jgi:2-C-methyl-D-erythritol 4-phosphate cytidylyltransferase
MSKFTAIILAAGRGKRMNSSVSKQYMLLENRPVLYYTLKAFQESDVDDIVLVVGRGEENYVIDNLISHYSFTKVKKLVIGGQERYHSVYEGLKVAKSSDYVLIHDGARPFVTKSMIHAMMKEVIDCDACIVGIPLKDTIKIVNEQGYIIDTPNRKQIWNVQTPQVFSYPLIMEAYEKLMISGTCEVTDDAMVVELMTKHPIRLVPGSYDNIKITTPEDILIAEGILKRVGLEEKS